MLKLKRYQTGRQLLRNTLDVESLPGPGLGKVDLYAGLLLSLLMSKAFRIYASQIAISVS